MNGMLLEEIANRSGWSIIHTIWQGLLVTIVVAAGLPMIRTAAARHTFCMAAMAAIASLAIANWISQEPQRTIPVAVAVPVDRFVVESEAPVVQSISASGVPSTLIDDPPANEPWSASAHFVPSVETSWKQKVQPFIPWMGWAWLAGITILTLRQLGGWWCVTKWRNRGVGPAPEQLSDFVNGLCYRLGARRIGVLISTWVTTPILAGLLKPVILLPAAFVNGVTTAEIKAILVHEVAHLRRRDGWAALLQASIGTLLFYHPGVWWIGGRARQERENAADDLAISFGVKRTAYVSALATLAGWQVTSRHPEIALAASSGSLVSRIRRLVDQPSAHHSGGSAAGWATGFAALVFTAIVGLGLIDKGAADGEDAPTAESTISVGPGSSVHDKDSAAPAPRYFLGVNYWALGEALAKSGLWKEAGRAHSEAVKYLKALVEEFPEEPTYKMALARDYAAVAKMLIGQGAPEKAVDYQRGTVIFFKEVVAAKSSTDAQRFELARHQRNYAEVLERSGHRSEALKEIREAAKIFNHLKAEGESLTRTLQLNLVEAARTYELHGDIAEQNKEVDEARAHFLKASDLWHDLMVIGVPEARLRHEMCQRRHTTLAGQVDVSE